MLLYFLSIYRGRFVAVVAVGAVYTTLLLYPSRCVSPGGFRLNFLGICRVVRAGSLDFNGVFGVRIMHTLIRLDLTQEFKGFCWRFTYMRAGIVAM